MLKKIRWFLLLIIVLIISPFLLFFGDFKNKKVDIFKLLKD